MAPVTHDETETSPLSVWQSDQKYRRHRLRVALVASDNGVCERPTAGSMGALLRCLYGLRNHGASICESWALHTLCMDEPEISALHSEMMIDHPIPPWYS